MCCLNRRSPAYSLVRSKRIITTESIVVEDLLGARTRPTPVEIGKIKCLLCAFFSTEYYNNLLVEIVLQSVTAVLDRGRSFRRSNPSSDILRGDPGDKVREFNGASSPTARLGLPISRDYKRGERETPPGKKEGDRSRLFKKQKNIYIYL